MPTKSVKTSYGRDGGLEMWCVCVCLGGNKGGMREGDGRMEEREVEEYEREGKCAREGSDKRKSALRSASRGLRESRNPPTA